MLTPEAVRSVFEFGPVDANKFPYLDATYPYDHLYNRLLLKAFPIFRFLTTIAFMDDNLHAMGINLITATTQFPVFILLIAPDNTPATSEAAEVAMMELLTNSDASDIRVIHGVCVYGTQAAFYQYDRERQVVSPEPQGQVHFDLDLATESGAERFVEVAEHVEQMCRERFPDLELPQ